MPAKRRAKASAARRRPARAPKRSPRKAAPKRVRKAARKPAREAARKVARKPARKVARKVARKAARKAARKVAVKPVRKPARKASPARKPARKLVRRSARPAKPVRKPARKPARKTARAPRSTAKPRQRSRGISTLPIPPKRTRTRSSRRPRRRSVPEVIPQLAVEDEPQRSDFVVAPAEPLPAEVSDGERDARPYMAVVSQIERTEPFPAQQEVPLFPSHERARPDVDTYPTDIPIAIASALLAGSVFVEWYKGPRSLDVSASGWTSGSLAPLILFLAAGSLLLVVLRRLRVSVSLPVEESLAHEAVGWVTLVAAVVKSRIRPSLASFSLTTSYGVWITIGVAALLVVLAGRMSPRAPLVFRPGWHRGRAGVVGLVMILAVIAGSAVFGATNSPKLVAESSNPDLFKGTVRGRLPDCAEGFPFPTGVKPEFGFDTATTCQAQLSSTQDSTALINAFKASLKSAKWTFTEVKGAAGSSVFSITKPRCATLAVVPDRTGSIIAVSFTTCPPPTPTAR